MKYCCHCGAELLDAAVVCPKCGCPVGEVKSESPSVGWNGLTIAGFVVSFFSGIVGLIMSIIALKQVRSSGENSKGMALAGIIISAVRLAAVTLYVLLYVIIFGLIFLGMSFDDYAVLMLF